MKTIKIFNGINKITDAQIELIADYLRRGQVIAYPTDTVYGLGCDAKDSNAIKRIKEIKGREIKKQVENKSMIILISDFKMLNEYCEVSEEQRKYLYNIWDKPHPNPLLRKERGLPTTVILKKKGNLPDELTGGLDSLAVRLPNNDFLIKIISAAGFPLVSTSLNKTGEPTLNNVLAINDHFQTLPDLAVDGGMILGAKPSRLIDLRDVKNIKVIRK